jgi:UrcA family protein
MRSTATAPKTATLLSITALGVACAAGLLAAAPASGQEATSAYSVTDRSAAPAEPTVSMVVSYRDLDLTTREGRASLRQRMWRTVETLCARIGESHVGDASSPLSCENQLRYSVGQQQRYVIAHAMAAASPNQSTASANASEHVALAHENRPGT